MEIFDFLVLIVTVEGKSLFYSRVIHVINVPEGIEPGLRWAVGRTASVCRNLDSRTGVRPHVWGRDRRHLRSEDVRLVARLNMVSGGDRESKPGCGSIFSPQSVGQFTIHTKYNKSNPS